MIKEQNHFDWPDATRNDLMYLSTIRNQNKLRSLTQDYKYTTNEQKKTYTKPQLDDIQTKIQKLEITRESMKVDDIPVMFFLYQGARPQIAKFKTNRECNPVDPVYRIPTYVPADPVQPQKFIRDTLNISDIAGTVPKIKIYNPRNVDPYTFIEGTKPRGYRNLINHQEPLDQKKQTLRQLDPLAPLYKWGEAVIGPVEGSDPYQHCKERNKVKSLSLYTQDIKGAQSDTVKKRPKEAFQITNNTQDIYKAQANTIQRGMQTKRQTNPLQPAYQFLGSTELYKN